MGLAVGDVCAVTYHGTYCGQQIRYVLHYRVTVAGSSVSPELDLDAMAANFAAPGSNTLTGTLQALHLTSFNFDAVSAQRVWPTRTIRMTTLSSFPGTITGSDTAPNTSVVVTKRTLTPGRMGLGSIHLSGVDNNSIVSGEIDTGVIASYTTFLAAVIAGRTVPAVTMSIEPGLFNPSFPPSFFSRLFDCILQTTIRVMRRRTVRLGI